MNILFVHSNGIVPTAGGISRTTANLAQILRHNGHKVWLLGATDQHPQAKYDGQQLFLVSRQINSKDNQKYLCEIIKNKDIKIIINQSPFACALVNLVNICSKQAGAKVISCYHNSILTPVIRYAYCHEYLLKQKHLGLLFHLMRWKPVANLLVQIYIARWRKTFRETIAKSDAIVLLCDGQVDEILRMCGYKQIEKVHVIPNCMPIVNANDVNKLKQVVWTGTFDYAIKRPDYMLKIWQKISPSHPDWTLYMLGDGPSLSAMKQLAEKKKIKNVVFTGRIVPDRYYDSSEIQCVTSVHESFSLVSVEAMTRGNPTVAFNSFSAATMVIKDGLTGFLITPFELDDYAKKLSILMDDNELRRTMGMNAKQSVARFSEECVYNKWNELMSKL